MEGNKQEFVLKKTVAMFNQLTGKRLKPNEGQVFLDLYDMVAEHSGMWEDAKAETEACGCPAGRCHCTNQMLAAAREQPDAVETFAAASHALNLDPDYHTQAAPAEPDSVPVFIGREVEKIVALKPEPEKVDALQGAVKKYSPPTIRTDRRTHILGYDWQIVVLDRMKREENSYIVHFAEAPTQDEFNEHFYLFTTKSHYVHINEWIGGEWVGVTEPYRAEYADPANPASQPYPLADDFVVHEAKAPEDRPLPQTGRDVSRPAMSDPWEQPEKPFRIRYYSDEAQATIYFYADKKPTSKEMAHFHHAKCLAVSQARPAEVAA